MFSKCHSALALFAACCCLIVVPCRANEVPRPRGISLSESVLYEPTGADRSQFVCIDGLRTIKFTQVNDDFCDCIDGSDEPGTSACPDGSFYCTNAGFRAMRIPSSRVNDGICDCCDASDEFQSTAQCSNNCYELGREDVLREKQRAELARLGTQLKAEMATKGQAKKAEHGTRLDLLKRSFSEAEALLGERELIKKDAEALESEALEVYKIANEAERRERAQREEVARNEEVQQTFRKYDTNGDGRVDVAELQTRISFDRNRDGEVSDEEARFFLNDQPDVDLDTFESICWSRIKPFLMLDSGLFKPPPMVGETTDEPTETGLVDEEAERAQTGEDVDFAEGDEEHGEEEYEEEEDGEEETGEGEIETADHLNAQPIEYDPDTKLLVEQANGARNLHLEAERHLREIKTEIGQLEQLLEKDYGADEEFATLHGECFNYEDREYVYKVCPFDRAVQQPKSGGAETRLGGWERWQNGYNTMVFANGAACWNGPQRSMHVTLECGLETKVLSVAEPNRCEYVATMQTPSVCSLTDSAASSQTNSDGGRGGAGAHDEL